MKKVLIFLAFQILPSCFWDSSFSYEIKKPYYLGVDYGTNQVCLHWSDIGGSGGTEKIPSKIKEVGWNDQFIIAKQESVVKAGKISYYVIDIRTDDKSCYDCPIGPLTKEQFLVVRDSLSVPAQLDFTLSVEPFKVTNIKQ